MNDPITAHRHLLYRLPERRGEAVANLDDRAGRQRGRSPAARTGTRGVLTFRTYTNRHGLGLDGLFDRSVAEYADHVAAPLTHS
jgi:hypothetical protein